MPKIDSAKREFTKNAKEHREIRKDIVSVEKKIDSVLETLGENTALIKKIPTREEFPELLRQTLEWAILKTEHDRMKRIIKERLRVEV